jgi:TPR repeat protein
VEKAAYWQERAVEGGDLIATYNLAVRLVAAGGAENEARARELYLRCLDEAEAGERVWGPTCRNLACLAFDGRNDAHKREAVERALIPLWWRGDDDDKLWAAGYLADIYHFGNGVPANAFLALTWLQRASEIDPEYVDVVRMAPLINGEGRWFGASRARKQQEQDRQQVDSATWALTFGQRSQTATSLQSEATKRAARITGPPLHSNSAMAGCPAIATAHYQFMFSETPTVRGSL